MKKGFSLFILLLTFAVKTSASKANSLPVTVIQPDGKPITIVLHGDEYYHYTTTTDGVLLCYQPTNRVDGAEPGNFKGGYYVARTAENGVLEPTDILAHNAGQRTRQEILLVQQQDKSLFLQQARRRPRAHETSEDLDGVTESHAQRITTTVSNYFPHKGSPRALVILAAFSDVSFKNDSATTRAIFDSLLNANGKPRVTQEPTLELNHGSVKQYFNDVSYGQFSPVFDVYGPVTLSKTAETYGKKNDMQLFLKHVCSAVDTLINFADYDANNDGEVDLVYVIYAGYGDCYAGNEDLNCIWPKSGELSAIYEQVDGKLVEKKFDGKSIVRYGVHCELGGHHNQKKKKINGIGLFCHEFSHTLGLPDLYAPSDNLSPNVAMEEWDLMDGGEYVGDGIGTCPTPYTAWEREICGWRDIVLLDKTPRRITLYPLDDEHHGYGYKMESTDNPLEYFFLQYIPNTGWNKAQNGRGMLVVHVKYGKSEVELNDNVNYYITHKMVVLAADGLLLNSYAINSKEDLIAYNESFAGDPFPGTLNVTELTDETEVNTLLFDKNTPLGQPIYNISEDTENAFVTFDYMEPQDPDPFQPTGIEEKAGKEKGDLLRIYDLQGRKLSGIRRPGLYIVNGKILNIK